MFGVGYFGSSYFAPTYYGSGGDIEGGSKKVSYTKEQIEGMEAFEIARTTKPFKSKEIIVTPDRQEVSILSEVKVSHDSQVIGEIGEVQEIPFALILAIWEAHNN